MNLQKIEWEHVDCIYLTQDGGKLQAFVFVVMDFLIP
jgi:hypothetical protein